MYGCANSCVKFLFFLVNLLICVFGALIFGFSLWANLDKNFGSHLADFVRKVDGADHTHIDEIAKVSFPKIRFCSGRDLRSFYTIQRSMQFNHRPNVNMLDKYVLRSRRCIEALEFASISAALMRLRTSLARGWRSVNRIKLAEH